MTSAMIKERWARVHGDAPEEKPAEEPLAPLPAE